MAIKRRRGEDQFSTTERNSASIEFSINSIQIKRRNSIKNKRRWRRKWSKRRRGERVEGVRDNYSNSFHQFERVNTMSYVWTDQRLKVLVTNFFNYVNSQNTCHSYVLLLQDLREPLLKFTDEEAKDYPEDGDIINILSEIAESYKYKKQHYYGLKERIGKPACKKLRALVKHERFNEYLPPGAKPTRVTDVNLSGSASDNFCWSDIRLQNLVYLYHSSLQDFACGQGTTEKNAKKFLSVLKTRLGWKDLNMRALKFKLLRMFTDYQRVPQVNSYRTFRIRLGKNARCVFDQLVARDDYDLYGKVDTTSSSRRTNSSRSRRTLSEADLRKAENKAAMNHVALELEKLALNDDQMGHALFKLTDPIMRDGFWSSEKGQVRRSYVMCMIGQIGQV